MEKWQTNFDDFAAFAKTEKHAGKMQDENSYLFRWTFRAYTFAEMRNAAVKNLQYGQSTPLRHVRRAFPDQLNWWGESLVKSIGEVVSDWGYRGPLEMFSVMLCVLGDAEFQDLDLEQLQALKPHIQRVRAATLKKYGYEGNPVVMIREAAKQD